MSHNAALAELLQWYADVGVDEAMDDAPIDRTRLAPPPFAAAVLPMAAPGTAPAPLASAAPMKGPATVPAPIGSAEAVKEAASRAETAKTLDDLRTALDTFPGLALKRTAKNMVFADGNAKARVMVIGDVPGADEDRAGLPFMGDNGALLDKMLGAIGLTRTDNVYMTTILNWRPPGGRLPEPAEIEISAPFIRRHIALLKPAAIMFIGSMPAKVLLGTKEQVMRLRGKWLEYADGELAVPAMAMLQPEYLIQNPAQKKVAWEDLQMFQGKLKELGVL